jgi:hypothetical protein
VAFVDLDEARLVPNARLGEILHGRANMKVQTNVKAGGGFGGLIDIVAIVIVDVDLLSGGGCCKPPRKGC